MLFFVETCPILLSASLLVFSSKWKRKLLFGLLDPMAKQWKQCQALLFWAPKLLQMVTAAMKLKDAYSLEGKL